MDRMEPRLPSMSGWGGAHPLAIVQDRPTRRLADGERKNPQRRSVRSRKCKKTTGIYGFVV
jgi:hypothetical protein